MAIGHALLNIFEATADQELADASLKGALELAGWLNKFYYDRGTYAYVSGGEKPAVMTEYNQRAFAFYYQLYNQLDGRDHKNLSIVNEQHRPGVNTKELKTRADKIIRWLQEKMWNGSYYNIGYYSADNEKLITDTRGQAWGYPQYLSPIMAHIAGLNPKDFSGGLKWLLKQQTQIEIGGYVYRGISRWLGTNSLWGKGTAETAVALLLTGRLLEAESLLSTLAVLQDKSGGILAAVGDASAGWPVNFPYPSVEATAPAIIAAAGHKNRIKFIANIGTKNNGTYASSSPVAIFEFTLDNERYIISNPALHDLNNGLMKLNHMAWEPRFQENEAGLAERIVNNPYFNLCIRDQDSKVIGVVYSVIHQLPSSIVLPEKILAYDNLVGNNEYSFCDRRRVRTALCYDISVSNQRRGSGLSQVLIIAAIKYLKDLGAKQIATLTTEQPKHFGLAGRFHTKSNGRFPKPGAGLVRVIDKGRTDNIGVKHPTFIYDYSEAIITIEEFISSLKIDLGYKITDQVSSPAAVTAKKETGKESLSGNYVDGVRSKDGLRVLRLRDPKHIVILDTEDSRIVSIIKTEEGDFRTADLSFDADGKRVWASWNLNTHIELFDSDIGRMIAYQYKANVRVFADNPDAPVKNLCNITYFFRDFEDWLEELGAALRDIIRQKISKEDYSLCIRAPGASAEELYTIAAVVERNIPNGSLEAQSLWLSKWDIKICGYNLNPILVKQAEDGIFPDSAAIDSIERKFEKAGYDMGILMQRRVKKAVTCLQVYDYFRKWIKVEIMDLSSVYSQETLSDGSANILIMHNFLQDLDFDSQARLKRFAMQGHWNDSRYSSFYSYTGLPCDKNRMGKRPVSASPLVFSPSDIERSQAPPLGIPIALVLLLSLFSSAHAFANIIHKPVLTPPAISKNILHDDKVTESVIDILITYSEAPVDIAREISSFSKGNLPKAISIWNNIQCLYSSGQEACEEEDYFKAICDFKEIKSLYSDFSYIYYLIADTYFSMAKGSKGSGKLALAHYRNAANYLEIAIRRGYKNNDVFELLMASIKCLLEMGDDPAFLRSAVQILKDASCSDPSLKEEADMLQENRENGGSSPLTRKWNFLRALKRVDFYDIYAVAIFFPMVAFLLGYFGSMFLLSRGIDYYGVKLLACAVSLPIVVISPFLFLIRGFIKLAKWVNIPQCGPLIMRGKGNVISGICPYSEQFITRGFQLRNQFFAGELYYAVREMIKINQNSGRDTKILWVGPGRGYEVFELMRMLEYFDHINLEDGICFFYISKEDLIERDAAKIVGWFRDFSSEGINEDEAKKYSILLSDGSYICDLNNEKIPFEEGSLDIIIFGSGVSEYLIDKIKVYSQIKNKLNRGGRAFVDLYHIDATSPEFLDRVQEWGEDFWEIAPAALMVTNRNPDLCIPLRFIIAEKKPACGSRETAYLTIYYDDSSPSVTSSPVYVYHNFAGAKWEQQTAFNAASPVQGLRAGALEEVLNIPWTKERNRKAHKSFEHAFNDYLARLLAYCELNNSLTLASGVALQTLNEMLLTQRAKIDALDLDIVIQMMVRCFYREQWPFEEIMDCFLPNEQTPGTAQGLKWRDSLASEYLALSAAYRYLIAWSLEGRMSESNQRLILYRGTRNPRHNGRSFRHGENVYATENKHVAASFLSHGFNLIIYSGVPVKAVQGYWNCYHRKIGYPYHQEEFNLDLSVLLKQPDVQIYLCPAGHIDALPKNSFELNHLVDWSSFEKYHPTSSPMDAHDLRSEVHYFRFTNVSGERRIDFQRWFNYSLLSELLKDSGFSVKDIEKTIKISAGYDNFIPSGSVKDEDVKQWLLRRYPLDVEKNMKRGEGQWWKIYRMEAFAVYRVELQLHHGGSRTYFLCMKKEKKEEARIPTVIKAAFAATQTLKDMLKIYGVNAGIEKQKSCTLIFAGWHPDFNRLYLFMRDKHLVSPVESDADKAISLVIKWSYALGEKEQRELLKEMALLLKNTQCPMAEARLVGKLKDIARYTLYWRHYAIRILAKFAREKNNIPAAVILWKLLWYKFKKGKSLLPALFSLDTPETEDLFAGSFIQAAQSIEFRKYLGGELIHYPAVTFSWAGEFSRNDVRGILNALAGNQAASPLAAHIGLIIFDLIGTLWEQGEFRRVRKQVSYDWVIRELSKRQIKLTAEGLAEKTAAIGSFTGTLRSLGLRLDRYFNYIGIHLPAHLYPDRDHELRQRMLDLIKKGYRLGLGTNNGNIITLNLVGGLGIEDLFACIMTQESIGKGKPDPSIFKAMCAQLNVMPVRAVSVGDSWKSDMESSSQAGLWGIHVTGPQELKETLSDKLNELIRLMPEIQSGRKSGIPDYLSLPIGLRSSSSLKIGRERWQERYTDWEAVRRIIPDLVRYKEGGIIGYGRELKYNNETLPLIREMKAGNKAAREALIATGYWIIEPFVKTLTEGSEELQDCFDDLIQVGMYGNHPSAGGLARAVELFVPERRGSYRLFLFNGATKEIFKWIRKHKQYNERIVSLQGNREFTGKETALLSSFARVNNLEEKTWVLYLLDRICTEEVKAFFLLKHYYGLSFDKIGKLYGYSFEWPRKQVRETESRIKEIIDRSEKESGRCRSSSPLGLSSALNYLSGSRRYPESLNRIAIQGKVPSFKPTAGFFRSINRRGFGAIELYFESISPGKLLAKWEKKGLLEKFMHLAARGDILPLVHANDIKQEKGIKHLKDALTFADKIKSKFVTMHLFRPKQVEFPLEEFVRIMDPVFDLAGVYGINIGIENGTKHSPQDINRVFEILRERRYHHVFFTFDLGHAAVRIQNNAVQYLNDLDENIQIGHVHLHGSAMIDGKEAHKPILADSYTIGMTEQGMEELLVKRKYEGVFSLEWRYIKKEEIRFVRDVIKRYRAVVSSPLDGAAGKSSFFNAAINRSVTLIIAYLSLIRHPKLSYDKVVKKVRDAAKKKKHNIWPNEKLADTLAMIRQTKMKEFEKLRGSSPLKPEIMVSQGGLPGLLERLKSLPQINKCIAQVYNIEVLKIYSLPSRPAGEVESQIPWILHIPVQVALSMLGYLSDKQFEFNSIGANEAASYLMFEALGQFFRAHTEYAGEVIINKDERYDVPGLVTAGRKFGQGRVKLEITTDIIESSQNVVRSIKENVSGLGTIFGLAAKGDFIGLPDALYLDKVVTGKNGKFIDLNLDRPVEEILSELAAAGNKKIDELKIAILLRDRHRELIRQLIDAGIKVGTDSFEEMKQKIERSGIYKNGNLYVLARNDLFPFIGLYNGKLDCILGVGKPTEGENTLHLTEMLGGKMWCRLVSYNSLSEGGKNINIPRDGRKFSIREKGILRRKGWVAETDNRQYRMVWESVPGQNRLKDAGIAIAFVHDNYWDSDVKGIHVDPKTGEICVDVFWAGASGEAKVFRITYKSRVIELKNKIDKTNNNITKSRLYSELAFCYLKLGLFNQAKESINKAIEISPASGKLRNKFQSRRAYIMSHISLVGKPRQHAVAYAISNLAQSIASWNDNRGARQLFRELCNYLAYTQRMKGEKLERAQEQDGVDRRKAIKDRYIAAETSYLGAVHYFGLEAKMCGQALEEYRTGLNTDLERLELERDRMEYELVRIQLEIIRIKLKNKLSQTDYADLGLYYESIGKLYKEYGLQYRAVVYLERALATYEELARLFGGRLPSDMVRNIADIYMTEYMYEPALKAYARLLAPEEAFKIYDPQGQDEQTRSDFFSGISYFKDFEYVLPQYVQCSLLLEKAGPDVILGMEQKTKAWLHNSQQIIGKWAEDGLLVSDKDGVLWVNKEDGKEKIRLLDIIAGHKINGSSSPLAQQLKGLERLEYIYTILFRRIVDDMSGDVLREEGRFVSFRTDLEEEVRSRIVPHVQNLHPLDAEYIERIILEMHRQGGVSCDDSGRFIEKAENELIESGVVELTQEVRAYLEAKRILKAKYSDKEGDVLMKFGDMTFDNETKAFKHLKLHVSQLGIDPAIMRIIKELRILGTSAVACCPDCYFFLQKRSWDIAKDKEAGQSASPLAPQPENEYTELFSAIAEIERAIPGFYDASNMSWHKFSSFIRQMRNSGAIEITLFSVCPHLSVEPINRLNINDTFETIRDTHIRALYPYLRRREKLFLSRGLRNIAQHCRNGIAVVLAMPAREHMAIAIIDNGNGFRNERGQGVPIQEAVTFGRSCGLKKSAGMDLSLMVASHADISFIMQPSETELLYPAWWGFGNHSRCLAHIENGRERVVTMGGLFYRGKFKDFWQWRRQAFNDIPLALKTGKDNKRSASPLAAKPDKGIADKFWMRSKIILGRRYPQVSLDPLNRLFEFVKQSHYDCGLIEEGYHRFSHNVEVAYLSLLLACKKAYHSQAALESFVSGLLHDFSPRETYVPPLVECTVRELNTNAELVHLVKDAQLDTEQLVRLILMTAFPFGPEEEARFEESLNQIKDAAFRRRAKEQAELLAFADQAATYTLLKPREAEERVRHLVKELRLIEEDTLAHTSAFLKQNVVGSKYFYLLTGALKRDFEATFSYFERLANPAVASPLA
ncbi:MAG: HAD-IA family hydrolase, partial [Candidatus Omnitrophica bacterium]|nr:HAD-IA family hydrolase [Candidatus Omnitrophota bacterium]